MKKYSIIILILCSWAMSLFAISCSDQESKPQPFLEIKRTLWCLHKRLQILLL